MTGGAVTDDTAYTGRNGYVDNAKILLDELHAHELRAPAGCSCIRCRVLVALDAHQKVKPPRELASLLAWDRRRGVIHR